MTDKIKKIIPVGIKSETEIWLFLSAIAVGIIRASLFFMTYMREYNSLFAFEGGKKLLINSKFMPDFHIIVNGSFNGFLIAIFLFLFLIIYHYSYHYKDSKSIYTMKRLPNKSELHIRCLTVPIIGITMSLIISVCLLLLFFHYYMTKTPSESLFPDQWERLWTAILYGGK